MTSNSGRPAIAVHGGAFDIAPHGARHPSRGLPGGGPRRLAGARGRRHGPGRGRAAVRELEGSGIFGAGRGSALSEEGFIELDAGIMDGERLRVGSVVSVRGVPHAITLARRVLESPFAVFTGHGAHQFAERAGRRDLRPGRPRLGPRTSDLGGAHGAPRPELGRDAVRARHRRRHRRSTAPGNLAAGTSTGGMPFKPAGRVGDSPFIGAGLYADNATGAASTTGHGERIIPVVLSKTATDLIGSGLDPQAAADRALARPRARQGPRRPHHPRSDRPDRHRLEHPGDGLRAAAGRRPGSTGRVRSA